MDEFLYTRRADLGCKLQITFWNVFVNFLDYCKLIKKKFIGNAQIPEMKKV